MRFETSGSAATISYKLQGDRLWIFRQSVDSVASEALAKTYTCKQLIAIWYATSSY